MKKSEEDRLKCAVCESTLSTAARSPFPNGEGSEMRTPVFSTQRLPRCGRQRGGGFAAKKGSQPRLAALGSPFQGKGLAWTLPPSYGRRCPEGAEGGWGKRYEKRSGKIVSSTPLTKAPERRWRGPPSPMGKAKRRRLRRKKRKPTPPRCARQPLPREGARVDTPSFLWKEVP